MSERTFKYVDKDRIIPWIDKEIRKLNDVISKQPLYNSCVCERSQLIVLEQIRREIIFGLFDWQPSE
jgi:hypothetical protein